MRPVILFAFLLIASCSKTPAEQPDTFEFTSGEKVAELKNESIAEASGLAASVANPGLLWIHNDSGNPAELFLIDQNTNVRMKCELKGAENRDWEDIAVGPGPDPKKSYVYVGEIGDNRAVYKYKMIYRFEEPVLAVRNQHDVVVQRYDTIVFTLEKEKDTEALLVDPQTRDLYIISKREEPVVVYRLPFPQSTTDTVAASAVTMLPLTQIVGGDISADRRHILLKNYQNVFYWNIAENESIAQALKRPAKILPYEEEPQGEAIAFARDGSGYFTVSEKAKGEKIFLRFYRRK